MFLGFLIRFATSNQNKPVLENCNYYNTYNYSCTTIPAGMNYSYGFLRCNSTSQVIDLMSGDMKCIDYSTGTKVLYDTAVVSENTSGLTTKMIVFFDQSDKFSSRLSIDYGNLLDDAVKACKSNFAQMYTPCQIVASGCALSSYYQYSPACIAYNSLPASNSTTYEYKYWPTNRPFIEYGVQASKVVDEHIMNTSFSKEQQINIVLARYSQNGTFLGYIPLTNQFDICTEKRDVNLMWQLYGTGYVSECEVNIMDLFNSTTTDLYDPFLIQEVSGTRVLRPIPVNILSYRDANEVPVNQRNIERKKRLFRRFFALDNYTNPIFIQYLSSMSIKFEHFNETSEERIPVITVGYTTVRRSDLQESDYPIYLDVESFTTSNYSFSIQFSTDISSYWTAALITLIILAIICIIIWLYRAVVTVKRYGTEGIDFKVIAALFAEAFNIVAWYLFIMSFIFSFAIFCAYKWTPSSKYTILGNEFGILTGFIWAAWVLSFIGLVIKYVLMLTSETFLIDWEPRRPSIPVSAWRRILVGNEFLKLHTRRSYNIPFTVITLVFILGGFGVDKLQAVLPSSTLIESGSNYGVLRFAIVTFIYILLLIFQYIITRIVWVISGSPYEDFARLCGTANVSVLTLLSPSWAIYLNGRAMKPADEGDIKLIHSISEAEKGALSIKPLSENRPEQVYECFLAPKFREPLYQAYDRIVEMHHMRPKNLKRANTSIVSLEAMSSFEQLNVFLQRFFGAEGKDREYDVWKTPFGYKLSRMPPEPPERSLLYAQNTNSLRKAIDGYGEWLLALFDLLLFVCVDYQASSTPIAAFVTLIIDAIMMAAWRSAAKRNLARKSLIDNRFFLN